MLLEVYFDFAEILLLQWKIEKTEERERCWLDLIYQDVLTEHKLG